MSYGREVGFVAAVVLPLAAITWIVTSIAMLALRRRPLRQAWLSLNRWWFVWPILAVYLGVAVSWLAAPVVLVAGTVAYHVERRRLRKQHT